jgi:hypothetical protein
MRLSQKMLREDEQGMPNGRLQLGEHESHRNRRVRTCIERERDVIMGIAYPLTLLLVGRSPTRGNIPYSYWSN